MGTQATSQKVCPHIKARDEYNAAKAASKSAKLEKTNCPGPKGPRLGANLYGQSQDIWQKAVY